MTLITKLNEIKKTFSDQILIDEKLSKYSWFNLGGPAKIVFKPKNLNELSSFLRKINGEVNIKVLGAGSNILIRDGGFEGVVIKLGKPFSRISLLNKNTLIAGASALDKSVSIFACENSISGFEFLSCIPGSIGGGVRMNSGCFGSDISKILVSVQVMDFNGSVRVIHASDINFLYRSCDLEKNLIFVSATFKGGNDKKNNIKEKTDDLVKIKKNNQPTKIKTCGSTFKNPKNKKAWLLIRDSGCSNMSVGDAYVSEKHCNFFVNKSKAKAQDVEDLIYKVENKVFEKTGIKLELEVEIIGDKI